MADWASSGSLMRGSHSRGSRLDVTMVASLRWRSVMTRRSRWWRCRQGLEGEVVEDEQFDGGQAAVLGFGAVVEAGGFEALEQLVGAGHVDGEAAADGDVAQGGGQVRLAGPDGPQDQGAVAAFGEPQGDQLVPELLVVADGGGGVPGVEAHRGVQSGGGGAAGGGAVLAAGDFVGQEELEEVGVREFLLAGEGEPFGEGGGELAELEGAQVALRSGLTGRSAVTWHGPFRGRRWAGRGRGRRPRPRHGVRAGRRRWSWWSWRGLAGWRRARRRCCCRRRCRRWRCRVLPDAEDCDEGGVGDSDVGAL